MNWMLYGANGYTGELTAARAVEKGQKPIVAGRREEAVRPLAERLGLPWRAFPLERLGDELAAVSAKALLLCAGPFSATSAQAVEACLRARAHYVDITGEILVFEAVHRRDADAKRAGVVLLPGGGFDVVPSDCLAASLARALPGATHLELAIASHGTPSKGTAKTVAESAAKMSGAVRENGVIRHVPLAWKVIDVPFRDETRRCVSVPWGDIATAFVSTKIPNITAYMSAPNKQLRALKWARPILPLLALGPVQRAIKWRIDKTVRGPDAEMRRTERTHLWGRVRDAAGRSVEGTLVTPEGYAFTVESSLEIIRRLLEGGVPAGAHTPATAFGRDFVTQLEGCDLQIGEMKAGGA
jgi:short subunit dehydrogenase-like uncharacterized protein